MLPFFEKAQVAKANIEMETETNIDVSMIHRRPIAWRSVVMFPGIVLTENVMFQDRDYA